MAVLSASTSTSTPPQGLLLCSVPWDDYLRLGRLLRERKLRLTYDRGTLEIMTLSPEHERLKHLLRRFVEAISDVLAIRIAGFGSMTCKRRKKRRGVEPDECYWVANAAAVLGKDHIDLRTDPPPDLAIEIDVTHSALDRMSIHAALRVPEVWQFDGNGLSFHHLQADGSYARVDVSLAFPGLTPADLMAFLNLRGQQDEYDLLQAFRAWLRQRFGKPGP
jgi:Uma2 family endonuclease